MKVRRGFAAVATASVAALIVTGLASGEWDASTGFQAALTGVLVGSVWTWGLFKKSP